MYVSDVQLTTCGMGLINQLNGQFPQAETGSFVFSGNSWMISPPINPKIRSTVVPCAVPFMLGDRHRPPAGTQKHNSHIFASSANHLAMPI